VDAMARIGYLYLREGSWRGKQLIPRSFVRAAARTDRSIAGLPVVKSKEFGRASSHYGLLWWNNADGTLSGVPRDAFWSWGLYDSLIVVIPSLDIVATRAGRSWKRKWSGHYDVLKPFFEPIVESVNDRRPAAGSGKIDTSMGGRTPTAEHPPYPPSPVIARIEWSPVDSIVRRARGSDNWPLTWGDDDRLYTAYGDGRGFRPFVERKLSLGLAVIEGDPPAFKGVNLRSPSVERTGDGQRGPKASGIVMVNGVLYLLVRNVGNAQVVWSADRGRTWTWCDWKFETSFGCPTFLNCGRNDDEACDDYVYIYSPDADSAYRRADRMVLARVPKDRIRERRAYEFFAGWKEGQPRWTVDIRQRGAVFEDPGNCYRSSVTYNAGLQRYLWCQTGGGRQPRFEGGLAIYDAPRPWGPWTTLFYTQRWDVGPGETSSFPAKWISRDGRRAYLVFSGDDAFSVREARFVLRRRNLRGVSPKDTRRAP